MTLRLAAVVVMALLSGCGKKSPPPDPPGRSPAESSGASQASSTPAPVVPAKPAEPPPPPKPDPAAIRAAELKALLAKVGAGTVSTQVEAIAALKGYLPESESGLKAALSSREPKIRLAAASVLASSGRGGPDFAPLVRGILGADANLASGAFSVLRDAGIPAAEFDKEIRTAIESDDDAARSVRAAVTEHLAWCAPGLLDFAEEVIGVPGKERLSDRIASVLTGSLPVPESVCRGLDERLLRPDRTGQKMNQLVSKMLEKSREREGRRALLASLAALAVKPGPKPAALPVAGLALQGLRRDPENSDLAVGLILNPGLDVQVGPSSYNSSDASREACAEVAKQISPAANRILLKRALLFFAEDSRSAISELVSFLLQAEPAALAAERKLACAALGSSDAQGAEALLAALAREKRPAFRSDLIQAMEGANPTDETLLRAILPDLEGEATRQAVLNVYAYSGPPAAFAVHRLVELLPSDPRVLPAIAAIGVGTREDAERLLDWMKSHDDSRRTVATCIRLIPEVARPVYINHLRPEGSMHFVEFIDYLGGYGTSQDVEHLRKLLKTKETQTQFRAIRALGRIGPEAAAAVKDLEALLNAGASAYGPWVLRALARIGVPARGAGVSIRKLLNSPVPGMALRARIALVVLGLEKRPSTEEWIPLLSVTQFNSLATDELWDLPAPDANFAAALKQGLAHPHYGAWYFMHYLRHERSKAEVERVLKLFPARSGWGREVCSEGRILAGVDLDQALRADAIPSDPDASSEAGFRMADALAPLAPKDPRAFRLLRALSGGPAGCHVDALLQKMRRE